MGVLARLELLILAGHKQPEAMRAIRAGRLGRESLLSGNEAFMLYSLAKAQSSFVGDMAEVGVYQGCSARIISLASNGAPLHLFDTFKGLPRPDTDENDRLTEGHYRASLGSVQEFLADRPNIGFYPGRFPETAGAASDRRFAFVHLDVDLRSTTLDCLEFFYPRLVPGGIIVSHDYSYLTGVREAFEQFCGVNGATAIELPTSQAMLVKA